MNKIKQREIEVHAHWAGLTKPALVGILHATPVRGKEIFSFEYDHEWLTSVYAQAIDPALQLFHGQWHAKDVADYFRIKKTRANEIIEAVISATLHWRKEASAIGISAREQDKMINGFRIAENAR